MTDTTRQITFRLSEEMYQALRKEAYEQEKSHSQIILEGLATRLATKVQPAQPKLFPEVVQESFFVDPGN